MITDGRKLGGFLLLLLLFIAFSGFSQTVPRIQVSGTVTDAQTGLPLHFANVFLSNTTMGAATDSSGHFVIYNVPVGTYEFVVSMIGYELHDQFIQLDQKPIVDYQIKLKPKILEIPPVEVTAPPPKEWRKRLKEFRKYLFGSNENAKKCHILNPEVLDFFIDDLSKVFSASAGKPLEIENKALGYYITFFLNKYELYETGRLRIMGKVRFRSLQPTNEKDLSRWQKARQKVYKGSIRHFLTALISDKLDKEGFAIYNYHRMLARGPILRYSNVIVEDILQPGENPFVKRLFFTGYLRVYDYKSTNHISWLEIIKYGQSVVINTYGHIKNLASIKKYGYWAKGGLADVLPLDFDPKEYER